MPVGIGRAALADCGERALKCVFVLHEDDAQPPSGLMVGEPVRLDPLGAKCWHDLLTDVRDAGLEILRRLVLEIRHLCSHAAILSPRPEERKGVEPAAPGADVRHMRLTVIAALSIVGQVAAGQVRAQLWKLQDARGR
jgi:hypothetical protein